MQVEVPRPQRWQDDPQPLDSAAMREQVMAAERIQQERYRGCRISRNSELSGSLLRRFAPLDRDATKLLQDCFATLGLSMRAYDRIIKLSRTIADLEGEADIRAEHVAEAIQYRQLDRRHEVAG